MADYTLRGSYIPDLSSIDVNDIDNIDVSDPRFKGIVKNLLKNMTLIRSVINSKESAYYDTDEFVTGQMFFPLAENNSTDTPGVEYRQTMRKVINFGALVYSMGSIYKSVPHGINVTSDTIFTRIYAVTKDPTAVRFEPIPNGIYESHIYVDATNVNIKTEFNMTTYTTTYVILEYIL